MNTAQLRLGIDDSKCGSASGINREVQRMKSRCLSGYICTDYFSVFPAVHFEGRLRWFISHAGLMNAWNCMIATYGNDCKAPASRLTAANP